MCEVSRLTGIEGLDVTKAFTPPSLPEGAFFFIQMNKTKKRAAKRASQKPVAITPVRRKRTQPFHWTFPLTAQYKIANLKCYRAFYNCELGTALRALNSAMDNVSVDQLSIDDLEF